MNELARNIQRITQNWLQRVEAWKQNNTQPLLSMQGNNAIDVDNDNDDDDQMEDQIIIENVQIEHQIDDDIIPNIDDIDDNIIPNIHPMEQDEDNKNDNQHDEDIQQIEAETAEKQQKQNQQYVQQLNKDRKTFFKIKQHKQKCEQRKREAMDAQKKQVESACKKIKQCTSMKELKQSLGFDPQKGKHLDQSPHFQRPLFIQQIIQAVDWVKMDCDLKLVKTREFANRSQDDMDQDYFEDIENDPRTEADYLNMIDYCNLSLKWLKACMFFLTFQKIY